MSKEKKRFCTECGAELNGGSKFCTKCGAKVGGKVVESEREESYTVSQTSSSNQINIPESYKPISMWGYFGYELLFSIPCVGFILLLVFAFGGTQNVNLKNFARSYFCIYILFLIILGILMLFGILGASAYYYNL